MKTTDEPCCCDCSSSSSSSSSNSSLRNNSNISDNLSSGKSCCNSSSDSSTASSPDRCADTRPSVVVVSRSCESPPTIETPPSPTALSSTSVPMQGPRFKLICEGDIQVCYINHTRTVISKIVSSKFLRRWENHRLYLNDSCISSKTPTALFGSIPYTSLQEILVVGRWDVGHKLCIRLVVSDGSILLQANNAYTRDQWYHSIKWKKNVFKCRNILKSSSRPEVILKELKNLVDITTSTPLQDECVFHVPIEMVSKLLDQDIDLWSTRSSSEELISTISPLFENLPPSAEICHFFSKHCIHHPRSPLIADIFTPIVHRILKHNVDYGKFPYTRRLVQDYIRALDSHNDSEDVIRRFVLSVHGPSCGCPHPRVLQNLISMCLAAIFSECEVAATFEKQNIYNDENIKNDDDGDDDDILNKKAHLNCYLNIIINVSKYDDWLPGLAQLLQPLPFPEEALANESFISNLLPVVRRISTDPRCDVHRNVLGIREGKEGWFDIFCPSNPGCKDEGQLWGTMLETLMNCSCKRKRFIAELVSKKLGACLLLALRDHSPAQTALCLALEWNLISEEDQRMTVITTLQSTASGLFNYTALCQRQQHLQELQQKGGPRKLTLPTRSTDSDVIRLLRAGAFGNLECLSLAFTHVTSACAEHLIKLPTLRYLNLWATKFGDAGLLIISEHLPKLQELNLCETPVSDKGILALAAMTNLKKLNLNSTQLSAETFEALKQKLPGLQEMDIRYTEAW
ncbi:C-Maf-inducing protein-like [Lycorma delicatula]|uniref:C-Maf-inducing protein-like n=1 Tax=Lycorma delicatula TaxID=130591 RepID=UPI003F519EFA